MHGIYKQKCIRKVRGKDICVPIYRDALKEDFFLIDIVQIYFATIKLNKYFTCLIFSCFFTQELQLHADLG